MSLEKLTYEVIIPIRFSNIDGNDEFVFVFQDCETNETMWLCLATIDSVNSEPPTMVLRLTVMNCTRPRRITRGKKPDSHRVVSL